ncbi:DUF6192 family protein [Streptomyces sp. NPDC006385]|uniref:DUF6192 family protein n=1 Tax=Streptomyces sp. NPDC006385 TaxID=3156761 RepID=UPI0033A389C6
MVTTGCLRRPAVASKATADGTTQHAFDEAPLHRFRQQAPRARVSHAAVGAYGAQREVLGLGRLCYSGVVLRIL